MSKEEKCSSNFCDYIPRKIMTELEARVFRTLCTHLRERSDMVANMDLMTVSGFCRNCLAKWLVLEARKLSDSYKKEKNLDDKERIVVGTLDALGYEEAALEVYGCEYSKWKSRYQTKPSEEQIKSFEESESLWAKHDKLLLQPRKEKEEIIEKIIKVEKETSLLSNVCCQNVDDNTTESKTLMANKTSTIFAKNVNLRVGILTVSDRASASLYETGDLSGPVVESSLLQVFQDMNQFSSTSSCSILFKKIVPDDINCITQILKEWSIKTNLIVTTGGTGFSARDVTPEATKQILDLESQGLMPYVSTECAVFGNQPLAALSRGVAGICGKCFIVNLPGNPSGISQIMKILLPLLFKIVHDLES